MKVVYKYQLPAPGSVAYVQLPSGFEALKVDVQGAIPVLWALVDPESPAASLRFRTYPTGHPVDDGDVYVGTFFIDWTVWHVFREPIGGLGR